MGPAFVTYSLLGMYPVVCDVLDSDFTLLERAGSKIRFASHRFPTDLLKEPHQMPNATTEAAEAQLVNVVVALDVNPNTANPSISDVRLAIENRFGSDALPVAITRFRSDFVIRFASSHERDLVVSSEVLYGKDFDTLLVRWSNRYGVRTVDWQTEARTGNMVFPVMMVTYNYSEAPAFVENEVHANPANFGSAGSVASFDTANRRLERAGYHRYASDSSSSSYSVFSNEPFYLPRGSERRTRGQTPLPEQQMHHDHGLHLFPPDLTQQSSRADCRTLPRCYRSSSRAKPSV
ncbi:unnamed protein product [Miscanthus lutarioriparius]|uniref:Uncharacterized protein n=1 Tax=Miscanthus lutarioriparius TaxID=422564 RepID=A0A811M8L1_9POAL|nr:unnamed protein product [Miscanthus lutarioriparius]